MLVEGSGFINHFWCITTVLLMMPQILAILIVGYLPPMFVSAIMIAILFITPCLAIIG